MSGEQTHSHGPGQPHHTHGPPAGAMPMPPPQAVPKPDPRIQASIDAQHIPLDIKMGGENDAFVLCEQHGQEKCEPCGVDYVQVNRLVTVFTKNPNLAFPPPPNMVPPAAQNQLSQAVNKMKEEGNTFLKAKQVPAALQRYTMAINIAAQRPPWEPQQHMREDLSTMLSNRAAAFASLGDHLSALIDAEAVIQLRRPWSKGHFRKAKALVGLNQLEDAREALLLGLQFEPTNEEMTSFFQEIEEKIANKGKEEPKTEDEKPAVVAAAA